MCTEFPVFKRCCFCVPLRHGLLTWGYLKLIAGIIGLILLTSSLLRLVLMMNHYEGSQMTLPLITLIIGLVLALAQIALNILLVVGAHMKNVKLLRVYFIYGIIASGITSVMLVVSICNVVPHLDSDMFETPFGWILVGNYVISFVDIALQIYILLVLRSEIIKLSDKQRVQYNVPRAELTMEYKERLPNDDTIPSKAYPALDGEEGNFRPMN